MKNSRCHLHNSDDGDKRVCKTPCVMPRQKQRAAATCHVVQRTNSLAIDLNGLRIGRGDKERQCRCQRPSEPLSEHDDDGLETQKEDT